MPNRTRPRRAFTLIELLVVLGIIALLVSITLMVGHQVKLSSETRFTQDTIRVLDNVMDAYIHATGEPPPPSQLGVDPAQPNRIFFAADARDMTRPADPTITPPGYQMLDGMAVFFFQASQVPEAKAVLLNLPSGRATGLFDPDGPLPTTDQPNLMTVLDAWKRPIRYVHPAFQGDVVGSLRVSASVPNAPRDVTEMFGTPQSGQTYVCSQIRRNHVGASSGTAESLPDSDGGTCPGARPYFYSAGPDGLVGLSVNASGALQGSFNDDNVYTTKPKLPSQ